YATDTVNLQPGDTLFLYTDGVTEAENSRQELFGEARLDEVLERNKTGNARKIIETVEQAVADFSAEVDQSDDITMLALTYHGLNDASRT
ncbi:MAG: serine/threonine-protein phosphatase, partial [Deltaproteobacteria bacterium]|nr:serine/threonine-protein phosphatase [Deltaproteobacteria bacterium]